MMSLLPEPAHDGQLASKTQIPKADLIVRSSIHPEAVRGSKTSPLVPLCQLLNLTDLSRHTAAQQKSGVIDTLWITDFRDAAMSYTPFLQFMPISMLSSFLKAHRSIPSIILPTQVAILYSTKTPHPLPHVPFKS